MYLVVCDHGNSSLMMVLWGWASGKKGYRDMRRYIVEKLGPGTYVYREDEVVSRALYDIQWKYGRDESGKNRLRVLRVGESDVDLLAEVEHGNQRASGPPEEYGDQSPLPSEDPMVLAARGGFGGLPDVGVDRRRVVYQWFISVGTPLECIHGIERFSYTNGFEYPIVLTLLKHFSTDPEVRIELREMGFADGELPDWVAKE
jgi:hypothetical protein